MNNNRQDEQLRSDQADGSIIAELYEHGDKSHKKGEYVPERYPTNREVASAIKKQVAVSADYTTRLAAAAMPDISNTDVNHHAACAWQSIGPPSSTKLMYQQRQLLPFYKPCHGGPQQALLAVC
jgi:hypothetical protein